jgi:cysteinyl-tRNA synthetase
MPLKFYNYLTRKTEDFKSIGDTVGLYTCGPTVYDYVHIGNWRTFVFEDVLKRVLVFNGYKVKHVMNLTDIDDKIIKKVEDQKTDISSLTNKFADAFMGDLAKLKIIPAATYPRARDPKYIEAMIGLTKKIVNRGVGYVKDGSVYFSIAKFKDYGKLSGTNIKGVKAGARVDVDEYDKKNPQDFVLWKKSEGGAKDRGEAFDSPWGVGRPGWHIECSAMSTLELGETIDIHTGGIDLLFPHHENEIAQSEAATGKKFVNFWMEGEHLLVDGAKMAKRDKNIFTLEDVVKKEFDPLVLRYLFLTAHYRSKLNFTWESLQSAQNALNNLKRDVASWDAPKIGCAEYEADFKKAVNDDLNMPRAVATAWNLVRDDCPSSAKHQSILVMDEVLGLGLSEVKKAELPDGAMELIEKREKLRSEGKFEESDEVRDELGQMGVEVEDTPDGSKWKIKK